MVIFSAVKIETPVRQVYWAVQRTAPNGIQLLVGRLYGAEIEARSEANRLNSEVASRAMG